MSFARSLQFQRFLDHVVVAAFAEGDNEKKSKRFSRKKGAKVPELVFSMSKVADVGNPLNEEFLAAFQNLVLDFLPLDEIPNQKGYSGAARHGLRAARWKDELERTKALNVEEMELPRSRFAKERCECKVKMQRALRDQRKAVAERYHIRRDDTKASIERINAAKKMLILLNQIDENLEFLELVEKGADFSLEEEKVELLFWQESFVGTKNEFDGAMASLRDQLVSSPHSPVFCTVFGEHLFRNVSKEGDPDFSEFVSHMSSSGEFPD